MVTKKSHEVSNKGPATTSLSHFLSYLSCVTCLFKTYRDSVIIQPNDYYLEISGHNMHEPTTQPIPNEEASVSTIKNVYLRSSQYSIFK